MLSCKTASTETLQVPNSRKLETAREFIRLLHALPDELPRGDKWPSDRPDPTAEIRRLVLGTDSLTGLDSKLEGLPHGVFPALHAVWVLGDFVRTRRFALAVGYAVKELESRFPTGPIQVVEVGCGPIPFMSIVAAALCSRVRVTAYEANPASAQMAKDSVSKLALGNQIKVLNCDAMSVSPKRDNKLFITETFDGGFSLELGPEIMAYWRKFVHPKGLMIPERISLDVGIVSSRTLGSRSRRFALPTGQTFSAVKTDPKLTGRAWEQISKVDGVKPIEFGCEVSKDGTDRLFLMAELTLLNEPRLPKIAIGNGDSFVTAPVEWPLRNYADRADFLVVKYKPGHLDAIRKSLQTGKFGKFETAEMDRFIASLRTHTRSGML